MRWYVSTKGQTSGPHEESAMRELVDRGYVTVHSHVRDEHGGAWLPIHASPLAVHVADQVSRLQKDADRGAQSRILLIGAAILLFGYGLFKWLGSELDEQGRKNKADCVKFWGGGEDARAKCK